MHGNEIWSPDIVICRLGDLEIWRFGDLEIWRFERIFSFLTTINELNN